MEHLHTVLVAEIHMGKLHFSTDLRHLHRSRNIFYFHFLVNGLKDTFQIGHGRQDVVVYAGQRIDRRPEAADIRGKCHHDTHRHAAVPSGNAGNTDHIDKRGRDRRDQIHHRRHQKLIVAGAQPCTPVLHAQSVKLCHIALLPGKRLGHADAGDPLCDIGVEVGLLIALDLPGCVLLAFQKHHIGQQNRQAAQTNQCQPRTHIEHKRNDKDQVAKL